MSIIYFFTTPRDQLSISKIYTPPESESNIIKTFVELGYAPFVDSQRVATREMVHALAGFVWIEGQDKLVPTLEYTEGRIFMLVYFNDPAYGIVEAAREFFSDLLGLQFTSRMRRTRKISKLFDSADFKPATPQPFIKGSKVHYHELPEKRALVARVEGGPRVNEITQLIYVAQQELQRLEERGYLVEQKV